MSSCLFYRGGGSVGGGLYPERHVNIIGSQWYDNAMISTWLDDNMFVNVTYNL